MTFSNNSKLSPLVHTFLALENPDYSCQWAKQIVRQSEKNVFKPRKTQIEIRSLDHQQYHTANKKYSQKILRHCHENIFLNIMVLHTHKMVSIFTEMQPQINLGVKTIARDVYCINCTFNFNLMYCLICFP